MAKIPPPPPIALQDPQLNRWFVELLSILNAGGQVTLSNISPAAAPLDSPAFTGTPSAPTPFTGDNSTRIATTEYVLRNSPSSPYPINPTVDGTASPGVDPRYSRGDHVHPTDTSRAAVASPAFTGTPAAPTAAPLTNTTQIATTAYADAAVLVEKNRAQTAEALLAPLASPAFTGNPTAPTPAAGDNGTSIATTAFVNAYGGAVRNGSGVPAAALGNNGDLYLNNTGGAGTRLYGKISGAWVAIA